MLKLTSIVIYNLRSFPGRRRNNNLWKPRAFVVAIICCEIFHNVFVNTKRNQLSSTSLPIYNSHWAFPSSSWKFCMTLKTDAYLYRHSSWSIYPYHSLSRHNLRRSWCRAAVSTFDPPSPSTARRHLLLQRHNTCHVTKHSLFQWKIAVLKVGMNRLREVYGKSC